MGRASKPARVAVLSRIPNPYRGPVYDLLAEEPSIDLTVLYCARLEPNRQWQLKPGHVRTVFLKERMWKLGDNRFVHFNWDVLSKLRDIRPDVVVTNGYNVSDLLAFLYALAHRIPHVSHTDGTVESERSLGVIHQLVRRLVAIGTSAYIGPSDSSARLFESWGIAREKIFLSRLAINNDAFSDAEPSLPPDDLLFSGRLTETKNPLFVLRVAARASQYLGRVVSVRFVGDGPLREEVERQAAALGIPVRICGFLQQGDLPTAYAGVKLFLFPTKWEPWGLVANEAAAAGLPMLVSEEAGAGWELVEPGVNGFRLALDEDVWARSAAELLSSAEKMVAYGEASRRLVSPYSWAESSAGFLAALRYALGPSRSCA